MMMTNLEIVDFWNWFRKNVKEIADVLQDPKADITVRLDERLSRLHEGIDWEVGPGETAENAFVLSPGHNLARLSVTRAIVRVAPNIKGWEFHASRPRKRWQYQFYMSNARGQRVFIDAREWRYSLIAYDHRSFFDVSLYAMDIPLMDDAARGHAARIAIEGAIGEEMAITRIGNIQLFDSSVAPSSTGKLEVLYGHITSLVQKR